jgi:hypothetical protein
MQTAATARAANLRTRLNALSLDLVLFTEPTEIRAAKQAIRAAEFELTALAVNESISLGAQ